MKIFLGAVVFIALAAVCNGNNYWKNVTRETFTWEHNMAIVKAHVKDDAHLQRLMRKPITKGISVEQTIFTLFTNNGPPAGSRIYLGDVASLAQGSFDPSKPVVIATHGFLSGGTTDWMFQMKRAQLYAEDCNFIVIDWEACADTIIYPTAIDCTKIVGGYMGDMIGFLAGQGADLKTMHLMGHSLGAHLVAQASQHGYRVKRITGWDPAGPLYDESDPASRIDAGDAEIVDIIHTDMWLFGYDGILGHYDFFPNGGDNQPGCWLLDELCNHSMSYYYYIQSLYYNTKYPASQCGSKSDAQDGKCSGPVAYMGLNSIKSAPGLYYIKVDEAATGEPISGGGSRTAVASFSFYILLLLSFYWTSL